MTTTTRRRRTTTTTTTATATTRTTNVPTRIAEAKAKKGAATQPIADEIDAALGHREMMVVRTADDLAVRNDDVGVADRHVDFDLLLDAGLPLEIVLENEIHHLDAALRHGGILGHLSVVEARRGEITTLRRHSVDVLVDLHHQEREEVDPVVGDLALVNASLEHSLVLVLVLGLVVHVRVLVLDPALDPAHAHAHALALLLALDLKQASWSNHEDSLFLCLQQSLTIA
jgi:hypothetical protein